MKLHRFPKSTSLLIALIASCLLGSSESAFAQDVEVQSAYVRVFREVEIPTREAGVLVSLEVQAGQMVRRGQVIGQIDDTDARINMLKAKREIDIAQREASNQLTIEFAGKALERAQLELANAVEAKRRVPSSIPDSRLDDLRLAMERSKYELKLSQYNIEVSKLQLKLKESGLQLAERGIDRRRVVAPLDGQVIEVVREAGEWVEPGKTIIRVVELSRLRIDGYIKPEHITPYLIGSPISIRAKVVGKQPINLVGRVTFVHPERKPVSGHARIWAEFKNEELQLAPGMSVTAVIQPQTNSTSRSTPPVPRIGSKDSARD